MSIPCLFVPSILWPQKKRKKKKKKEDKERQGAKKGRKEGRKRENCFLDFSEIDSGDVLQRL